MSESWRRPHHAVEDPTLEPCPGHEWTLVPLAAASLTYPADAGRRAKVAAARAVVGANIVVAICTLCDTVEHRSRS